MTHATSIQDAWTHCPRCGNAPQLQGRNPFRCDAGDCGYTHYFSPCTATAALIVDARADMLFIVRGKDPGKGKLGFPGGFVDAGETAEQSLVREVQEELNLEVMEYRYLASFPNEYSYGGVVIPVTDLFYVASVRSFDNMQVQAGEVDMWKFLPANSIAPDQLAFRTHQQALEAYLQTSDG